MEKSTLETTLFANELWSSLIKQSIETGLGQETDLQEDKKINLWISPVLMFSIFDV